MGASRSIHGGFTFVEILVAMMLIAIVVPVAIQGLQLANRTIQRAVRQRQALELAERLIEESIATGSWREGDRFGQCGEHWPGFTWSLGREGWSEDTMRVVTVRVSYAVQGKPMTERLSTLVSETTDEETAYAAAAGGS